MYFQTQQFESYSWFMFTRFDSNFVLNDFKSYTERVKMFDVKHRFNKISRINTRRPQITRSSCYNCITGLFTTSCFSQVNWFQAILYISFFPNKLKDSDLGNCLLKSVVKNLQIIMRLWSSFGLRFGWLTWYIYTR